MPTLVDLLHGDHALIRRAAACLNLLATEALEERVLRVDVASDLLEFFEEFADGIHQTKEERLLFPELRRAGLGKREIQGLITDHHDGRSHLRLMRRHLQIAAFGNPVSREVFARSARTYAAAELEHADDEDRVVLPLVEESLGPEAQASIVAGFRNLERCLLARPIGDYRALVERSLERLGEPDLEPSGWDAA